MPTFRRLLEKHPDATMKWFAKGKLWESPEDARRDADARTGSQDSPRPSRGRSWRPGGEHRDPRQPFIDAKKARNIDRRKARFERQERASTRPAPPTAREGEVPRVRREDKRPPWVKPTAGHAGNRTERPAFGKDGPNDAKLRERRPSSGQGQSHGPKSSPWRPKPGGWPSAGSPGSRRTPTPSQSRPTGFGPSGKGPHAPAAGRARPVSRPPSGAGDAKARSAPRPYRPDSRPDRRDGPKPPDRRRR